MISFCTRGSVRVSKAAYLIEQIKIKINREFGSPLTPAMLYNYYMSICLVRSYDLTDDVKVGRQIGYPSKTVGNVRRKLQRANWLYFDKFTHKGKAYGQWFIGKDVVASYKMKEGKLTLKEQHTLGLITDDNYKLVEALDSGMY